MGVVFLARDTLLGRDVALKTFSFAPAAENAVFRARLLREARTAGRLSHPNIVMVHDVFEENDAPYIAMEYVEGIDLLSYMQRQGRIDVDQAAGIAAQVADALDYAHVKGVIHRDIKPANIILTADLEPKITDFGIACVPQSTLTTIEHFLGTPNYMAPEQIEVQPSDGRADLFSLGVVLFEMLTGERPFPGANILLVARQIVEQPAPLATALAPEVSPGLAAVIDRMLAKDPDRRYRRGSEVSQDLKLVRDGALPAALLANRTGDVTLPIGALGRSRSSPFGERLRRGMQRAIRVAAVAAVTALVGTLAAVAVQYTALRSVPETSAPDPRLERLRESIPHLQDGLRLYRVKRYADALVAFERALALSPERETIRAWRDRAEEGARRQRSPLEAEARQQVATSDVQATAEETRETAEQRRATTAVVALDIALATEVPSGGLLVLHNDREILRRRFDFDAGSPLLRRLPWRSRVAGELVVTCLVPPGAADFEVVFTGGRGRSSKSRLRARLERGDQPVLRLHVDRRRDLDVTLGFN
jgi:serine/threonine-protein kinase